MLKGAVLIAYEDISMNFLAFIKMWSWNKLEWQLTISLKFVSAMQECT